MNAVENDPWSCLESSRVAKSKAMNPKGFFGKLKRGQRLQGR
jgi:hypothetical protein